MPDHHTDGGYILSVSPRQFRHYAAEYKALAAAAVSDQTRQLYLKMTGVWLRAAVEFETGIMPDRQQGEA
jgi:hypothetical protein